MKPRGNRPWALYIADKPREPHPTRRGWWATEEDKVMAAIALKELDLQRLRVQLTLPTIPSPDGRKLRTAISSNPGWYQTLVHRRPQHKDGSGTKRSQSHSIRAYVVRALTRIREEGYIRPNAMDVEILEVIYEDPNFGR